jgi:hypothetical protein
VTEHKKRRTPRVAKTRFTASIDFSSFLHPLRVEWELAAEGNYHLPDHT